MRLIDAHNLTERIQTIMACWRCSPFLNSKEADIAIGNLRVAVQEIQGMPTIDPEDLREHGKWIPVDVNYPLKHIKYKCSLCGRYENHEELYCNCGAKMDIDS